MSDVHNHMLAGHNHAPAQLGHILILGLGKSGKAACTYCAQLIGSRIDSVSVAVGKPSADTQEYIASLKNASIDVLSPGYDIEGSYDLCIASPGISQFSEFYQDAQNASTELISEVEFAWRESKTTSTWIAITGTNGKTTTTALVTHILRAAGKRASAVGNIGTTCLEAVMQNQSDIYVAEVSSYQLASTRLFAPNIAMLLNITPDHLSWHTSHEEYIKAKLKVFSNLAQHAHSYAIIDATGNESRAVVKRIKSQLFESEDFSYIPIGGSSGLHTDMRKACSAKNAAFEKEEMLCLAFGDTEYFFGPLEKLRIKGTHNAANALAACAAALVLNLEESVINEALQSFAPLEHRMEECGSIAGVQFVNDSKATNVDAACKALGAFVGKKPIVLLGGQDKGTDLSALVSEAEKQAKTVICYGQAGKRIYEAFKACNVARFLDANLEEAFLRATHNACAGDVVLLSPACASFDEFESFEHRGRAFKELVRKRSTDCGG